MNKASIKTSNLKDFLSLFDEESIIIDLNFGDTWHPSSGYIDESILNGKNTVRDLLDFDYDFKGLVCFDGKIEGIDVYFKNHEFEIIGTDCQMRKISDKVIEKNAYFPGKFTLNRKVYD
ncbi:MAG: hypothetical protein ACRBHB_04365 [Arenicella sp.]